MTTTPDPHRATGQPAVPVKGAKVTGLLEFAVAVVTQ